MNPYLRLVKGSNERPGVGCGCTGAVMGMGNPYKRLAGVNNANPYNRLAGVGAYQPGSGPVVEYLDYAVDPQGLRDTKDLIADIGVQLMSFVMAADKMQFTVDPALSEQYLSRVDQLLTALADLVSIVESHSNRMAATWPKIGQAAQLLVDNLAALKKQADAGDARAQAQFAQALPAVEAYLDQVREVLAANEGLYQAARKAQTAANFALSRARAAVWEASAGAWKAGHKELLDKANARIAEANQKIEQANERADAAENEGGGMLQDLLGKEAGDTVGMLLLVILGLMAFSTLRK